jgi:hypothetical protein
MEHTMSAAKSESARTSHRSTGAGRGRRLIASPSALVAFVMLSSVSACGGDGEARTPEGEPRYVLSSAVFDVDYQATTYLALLGSLDQAQIDWDQAREFPGFADLWVRDGSIFVSEEDLTITKFSVDGGELVERGQLGFAGYGPTDFGFWRNTFISSTKAYFLNNNSEYIVWNPQSMEITGTVPLPVFDDRDDLKAYPGYSDRAAVVRDGLLFQPMYWTDESYFKFSPDSRILVFDVERDALVEVLEAPCPGLDFATSDSAESLYFSSWVFAPGGASVLSQPATCVVKLSTADLSLSVPFNVADVMAGHEGGIMRHLGGENFLFSVLHSEHAPAADAGDPQLVANGNNWRFWSYDQTSGSASALEGVDWNSGGAYAAEVDGRKLMLVPTSDYSATTAYELAGDGSPRRLFDSQGWSLRLFELE